MIATIISLLSVVGGVLIAYFRWRSSGSKQNREAAEQNAKQAKDNGNAAVATVSDTIKWLRDRAKRKNK